MTNSTTQFWAVNGVSLQTFAFNITSFGDKATPPPTRGTNLLVPMAAGQTYVPKIPDSRTLTLNMWVTGANQDGSIPRNPTQYAQFVTNWNILRNLFWNIRQQMTLTKIITYPDSSQVTVTALAEFAGGLQPSMQGQGAAIFSVDLLLADPFFYGPLITTALSASTNITAVGDDRTEALLITLSGARTNLRIQNSSPANQPFFVYNFTGSTGDTVVFDVANYTVTHTPSGSGAYQAAGRVSHGADPNWMFLNPGVNSIVTSGTGAGTVSLAYKPRWI